jgi:bacillithiol biosynthesis deacetylase BshB1
MAKYGECDYQLDLLAFAAHPDDAELFCGGLLIKSARAGYRTGIVDLTRAELSSYGNTHEREEECGQASAVMGLAHRENLALPNCWLDPHAGFDDEDREATSAVGRVVETLRRLRPEVLLVPCWHDRHPDHIAASQLVSRAIFLAALRRFGSQVRPPHQPRQVLFYAARSEFCPSFVVDISEAAAIKYQAIRCYRSQVEPPAGETRPTLLSSPLALRALEFRDGYTGSLIGCSYAEGYLSQSALRIDDVVGHFRQWPADRSLYFLDKSVRV